jgi:hypothetical protein
VTESLVSTPVRRVCALLVISVAFLAGCKVDARVDVTLRADGSGTVSARVALDADAVQRLTLRAPLDEAVPLADVRAAGWTVSAWTPEAGGGDAVTLAHGFVGQADLAQRLKDLVGTTGVLQDAAITRTRSWFDAKDAIAVSVDLRHLSTGIRSDAEVARRLAAAGLDVNTLDAQLKSQLGHALTVTVTVHAPNGHTHSVQVTAGGASTASVSSSRFYTRRIVLFAAGIVFLVGALLLTGVTLAARSRRRRRS